MRELEEALRLTFEDQRLSKSEKYDFRDLLETYKDDGDALSFVRNKAFDMAAVVKDRTSNHMHNKFALIDPAYVVSSSRAHGAFFRLIRY